MATAEDVRRLAALARISISEEELAGFTKEFDAILAYVSQLEKLAFPKTGEKKPLLKNVTRPDGQPHEKGAYTEKLTTQFPARDGDYLSVKPIIQHD